MKTIIRHKLTNSKRRIQRRLDKTDMRGCDQPIMTASNIHYEIADRSRGISVGGIERGEPGRREAMPYFWSVLRELVSQHVHRHASGGE